MTQLDLGLDDTQSFYSPDPAHLPKVEWRPPRVGELPSWADAKLVCIDIETKDPNLKELGPGCRRMNIDGSCITGIGFAIEDGPAHYVPLAHHGGDNVENPDAAIRYFQDQLKEYRGKITGIDLGYDMDWLEQYGIPILRHDIRDVGVLDVLLYELHERYDLTAVCERHGVPGKDEAILREVAKLYRIDPKKEMWKLPARYVAEYALADVRGPLRVLRRQERQAEKEGIDTIWELERQVTPILVKMKRRGVRVDLSHVSGIERACLNKAQEVCDRLKEQTGYHIQVSDLTKAAALGRMFEKAGYTVPRTPKTNKPSVKNKDLDKYGEMGMMIKTAREWNNLRNTFCGQVRRFQIDGRVHCTFNQVRYTSEDGKGKGVRYGRLSSSSYNMQGQPVRHDDYGALWRAVYLPEHDCQWACSDWSQQEPRIGVYYAERLNLPGAKEFADEYRADPDLDIHQKLADLSGTLPRKIVKNYVNGRLYGMGDALLCHNLGLPTQWKVMPWSNGRMVEVAGPEGQDIIDAFKRFAPWIPGLVKEAKKAARRNGCVWTIGRRRCNFIRRPDGSIDREHKAFNRVGQGSAADMMKQALVIADREGIPVQLAVHDEFDFSFSDIKQALRLREIQRHVYPEISDVIPMKVDLEIGPNWGELTKVPNDIKKGTN